MRLGCGPWCSAGSVPGSASPPPPAWRQIPRCCQAREKRGFAAWPGSGRSARTNRCPVTRRWTKYRRPVAECSRLTAAWGRRWTKCRRLGMGMPPSHRLGVARRCDEIPPPRGDAIPPPMGDTPVAGEPEMGLPIVTPTEMPPPSTAPTMRLPVATAPEVSGNPSSGCPTPGAAGRTPRIRLTVPTARQSWSNRSTPSAVDPGGNARNEPSGASASWAPVNRSSPKPLSRPWPG